MGRMTRYRALRRLYYPGPMALRRLRAGERVAQPQRVERVAEAGQVLEARELAAESLPWLLLKGWIERVEGEE